jgi:CDP-diglyceride synthetase
MQIELSQFLLTMSQAFTLLLPITFAGLCLIMCMRKGWLEKLDVPLDGGLKLGGEPLIGKSKSLRSLIVYLVVATLVTLVLNFLAQVTDLVAPVFLANPFVLGPAITLSYLLGEIVNSFIKRRFGIAPSGTAPSRWGSRVQSIFDNLDGIISSGLLFIFIYQVSAEILRTAFVLSVLIHLSTDLLMRKLQLKRK